MSVLATDNFTRLNENPLSDSGNWTKPTGFSALELVSDAVETTSSVATCAAAFTGVSAPNDQWSRVTMDANSAAYCGPAVRMGNSAGYAALCGQPSDPTVYIQRLDNGSNIASHSYTPGSNDVVELDAKSTTLTVILNGTPLFSTTDSTFTSGSFGIAALAAVNVGLFTAWEGGNFLNNISGNAGVAGATVAWTGTSSGSTTADGSGNYTITNLGAGTYTVTPSLAGYSFSPTSHSETISGSDITGVNFTVTHLQVATATFSPVAGTYSEAQTVTVSNASSALSGFAMYYTTDGSSPTTGSTLYTGPITVSDSLTLKVLSVATGYLNSAIASAAYIIGFAISENAGVAGATVNVTGTSAGSSTADGSGNYSVSGLMDGSYTVTPVLARYKFTPASRNKTISGGDVTGVNFTAKLSYSNHRSK